jgi:outer membrane protein assembly factor BamD (BamD/ComL family)
MMSPQRITKREIKQDKFVTFSFKLTEWIQKHLNQVLTVAGAVIVVAAVVIYLVSSQAKRERQAAELFGSANLELQSGNISGAVSDLQALVTRYGSSKMAGQATYYLASAYYYARDYAQAETWFQKYLDQYGKDVLLASSAQAGIADCHMQTGDYSHAGDEFLKAISMYPSGFMAPQYLMEAASAFAQAGRKDQAKEALDRVISDYPDSREARQAKMKLAELP